MILASAFLGFALLPLAAGAQDATPPVKAVSVATPANPVVCRYYYYEGTVIRRPVCVTAHEWQRQRLLQQRLIREFQQRALIQQN
jgi:hypothetical protein